MNTGTLKEIIVENEKFITNLNKPFIPREGISYPADLNKVCILHGVRRTGKSFILYDLFRKHVDSATYIDFEDDRLTDFPASNLAGIKEAFFELKPHLIGKSAVFLLDEVQNVAGWEKFARRMIEKENFKVFCAGSSSKITPQSIHTSLRGRSWSIEIYPFSFREFLLTKDIELTRKDLFYGDKRLLLKKHFMEYLQYGGFPEVVSLKDDFEKRKVLKEYLEAMFFKDLVERFKINNINLLDTLRDKLFSSFATKFSITSFYKQYKDKFSFSKDSLFRYYKYFLESMLIFEVRKLSESSYKRLRNPAKIYVIDAGISKRVTSSDTGRLMENVVFLELKRKGLDVFYFEQENECDFAVNDNGKWSVFQVTLRLNEENREREINGLTTAAKFLKLKEGTIITYDEENQFKHQGIDIKIIPIWKWLLVPAKK